MVNEYVESHRSFYNQVMAVIEADSSKFQIIDAVWFGKWVRGEEDLGPISIHQFVCNHSKLNPAFIHQIKYVSVEAWKLLVDRYGGGPSITNSNLCYDCALSLYSGSLSFHSFTSSFIIITSFASLSLLSLTMMIMMMAMMMMKGTQ